MYRVSSKKLLKIENTGSNQLELEFSFSLDQPETNIYFQKIRAFSDFALDVPFNPAKIQADMTSILDTLSPAGVEFLTAQVHCFEEDLLKYCNQQV